jgi:AmmeMemoRadiSam system protein B
MPVRHDGKDFLAVRDSLGLVAEGLALRAEIAPLLACFDGRHSQEDLLQALSGKSGDASMEDIGALVAQLDELGILQTERHTRALRAVVESFAASSVREAVLAGSAYPADPEELASRLDDILGAAGTAAGEDGAPVGIVAPHIDLTVSRGSYGAAYRALAAGPPSAVLLLGTGHALERPYSVSEKTFRTPLGEVHAQKETCRRLVAAGGAAVAPDDFVHRSEHSLEFQLLFLQRLYPMETIPVLPVLCGSFGRFLQDNRDPRTDPGIRRFIGELSRWIGEGEGRIVVAGVDFSHVGPKFGDADEATALEEEFRDFDGKLLKALEAGDSTAFLELGVTSGNCYKVCGFSALFTLLAMLPEAQGTVLDYQVWHEAASRSAVSFAALSFSAATARPSL